MRRKYQKEIFKVEPTPINSEIVQTQPGVLPRGSFIIPQDVMQGYLTSALEPWETRLIKEVTRLQVVAGNFSMQLNAAHDEIDRLNAQIEELITQENK